MATSADGLNNVTVIETQVDFLGNAIVLPVGKLDADQYAADDIDGVTESLFGSGNMNFLSLQAAQTNEMIGTTSSFVPLMNSEFGDSPLIFENSSGADIADSVNIPGRILQALSQRGDDAGGLNIEIPSQFDYVDASLIGEVDGAGGSPGKIGSSIDATATTNTTLTGDDNFSDVRTEIEGPAGRNGINGTDGTTPTASNGDDGDDGSNGNDGNDGDDGDDGNDGGGSDDGFALGLHVDVIDTILGDLFVEIGDTIKGTLTAGVDLAPITGLLNDITGLDLPILADLDLGAIFDIDPSNIILNLGDINDLGTALDTLDDLLNPFVNLYVADTSEITGVVSDLLDNTPLAGNSLIEEVIELANDALDPVDEIINVVEDLVSDPLATVSNILDNPQEAVEEIVDDVLDAALGELDEVVDGVGEVLGEVTGGVEDLLASTPLADNSLIDEVLELVDDALDPVEGIIDAAENLVADPLGTVTDLLENPQEAITGLTEDVLSSAGELNEVVTGVGEVINEALDGGLTETVEDLGEVLTGGLFDGLPGLGGDNNGSTDGDITAGVDLGIVDLPLAEEPIDLLLDPVEDLVGDLDLGTGLGLDLLGNNEIDNANGDNDLSLGLDIDALDTDILDASSIDIPLDPLEQITGDIDLDLGIATNVLGDAADGLLNGGEGGTGEDTPLSNLNDTVVDIADGVLSGDGELGEGLGLPTDLSLLDDTLDAGGLEELLDPLDDLLGDDLESGLGGIGSDLLGDSDVSDLGGITDDFTDITIPNIEFDLPLDSIENLMGDVDVGVESALDLLESSDIGITGDDAVLGDVTDWTESLIPDGGGMFDDILSGIGGETDALPEPVTSLVEGLGSLNIDDNSGAVLGKLGGLFG